MTPLEAHVHDRMTGSVRQRLAWDHLMRGLPDSIRQKLWKWPCRHMRGFPTDVAFEPVREGEWKISVNGKQAACTVPMSEWIGSLAGRPVTIVAGGPSARQHPFEEAAGRFIIAVNGVPALLAEKGIRPDAVVISDPRLAFQVEANFPHTAGVPIAMPAKVAAFLARRFPDELASRPLCLIERVNQWHGTRSLEEKDLLEMNRRSGSPYLFPADGMHKSLVGWSHRPELGFFSGCTVPFAALQIAAGLGARDIEIVGMDLNGQGHAYKEEEGAIASSLLDNYQDVILPSFRLMHQALAGTGVVVRNLSPVCPLPPSLFS